jgi:hypothetical protein
MDGKPAPRAEFSLAVVDEAIFAIRRDTTRDIVNFFFEREWNRSRPKARSTTTSTGEAGQAADATRGAASSVAPRATQARPFGASRKSARHFRTRQFWATDIVTDAAGKRARKSSSRIPSLTWRATARGITPDTKVGSATLKTIVRKNLILRISAPALLRAGRRVVISAAGPQLPHRVEESARLAAGDGPRFDRRRDARDRRAQPQRCQGRLALCARSRCRKATITGKALTNEESDAVEIELPVNVPGVKLTEARGGSFARRIGGVRSYVSSKGAARVADASRSASSPSIAGSLFGGRWNTSRISIRCVEQTMSSFLPNHRGGRRSLNWPQGNTGSSALAGENPRRPRPLARIPA